MDNNQGSFLDKNTLIAAGLTIAVWVGWTSYMEKKYPNQGEAIVQTTEVKTENGEVKTVADLQKSKVDNNEVSNVNAEQNVGTIEEAEEVYESLSFSFDTVSFDVVSKGMGISNITLKNYTDRKDKEIEISTVSDLYPNFGTKFKGNEKFLNFKLTKISDTEVIGEYSKDGITIEKKYEINPEKYLIKSTLSMKGDSTLPNVQTLISEKANAPAATSLFSPSLDKQEIVVKHKEGLDREVFSNEEPYVGEMNSSYFVAMTTHYFGSAVIDHSSVIPNFSSNYDKNSEASLAYLTYPSFAGTKTLDLSYELFFGPKDIGLLKSIDANLMGIVDLGWFSFIAEPLLSLLKWLHAVLGNWGIAIIALTLLVRLVVMPFNIMSFKSMKKMQEIQPALKSIREKYKDDQVRMNQEVMAVMSQNKVNPMGGCLPMLLQFPVFIALYRVLSESVDLYKAPFGLWITDLSLKDPYYVLPILMGLSMFIQQKITPNTMDPAQQKVMALMPLMFSFIMISLPSGLTLYIFVSTVFGIVQQQLFMNKPQTA